MCVESVFYIIVYFGAQRLGIPLATIGEALQTLPDGRTPTAKDWERLSALWREDLDERINKLLLLRDKLNGCIGCGCLSLEACPLRNQDDQLGERGPGAQLLGLVEMQGRDRHAAAGRQLADGKFFVQHEKLRNNA